MNHSNTRKDAHPDRRRSRRRLLLGAGAFWVTAALVTAPAFADGSTAPTTTSTTDAPSTAPSSTTTVVTGHEATDRKGERRSLVALGDSYTSGVGAGSYDDASSKSGCMRTSAAYPAVAAKSLKMSVRNVACSGATTAAFGAPFRGEPAQVDAVVGADAVVMTIGGDDVDALLALGSGTKVGLDLYAKRLQELPTKLQEAFGSVRDTAPGAQVLAVGYPDTAPSSQQALDACADLPGIGSSVDDLHRAVAALNAVIKTSAAKSGIGYVDTTSAFAGHELCSEHPYVSGLSVQGVMDRSALHPTASGQRAMAKVVATALRSGQGAVPSSAPTTAPTTIPADPEDGNDGSSGDRRGDPGSSERGTAHPVDPAVPAVPSGSSDPAGSPTGGRSVPIVLGPPPTVVGVTTTTAPAVQVLARDVVRVIEVAGPADEETSGAVLASTGAGNTLRLAAIGLALTGTGLGLVWLRLVLRDRRGRMVAP